MDGWMDGWDVCYDVGMGWAVLKYIPRAFCNLLVLRISWKAGGTTGHLYTRHSVRWIKHGLSSAEGHEFANIRRVLFLSPWSEENMKSRRRRGRERRYGEVGIG